MRWIIAFALLVVVAESVGAAAAQPLPFVKFTESTRLAGENVRVDVYLPSAGSPQGVAILAHGFARTRVRHRDLAQALAAAGFIALVPDLPELLDPWRNAAARWFEDASQSPPGATAASLPDDAGVAGEMSALSKDAPVALRAALEAKLLLSSVMRSAATHET